MKDYQVIDLFCGVGGLSEGFKQAGYRLGVGLDEDKNLIETYRQNVGHVLQADITMYDFTKLGIYFDNKKAVKVLIGSPPCQPYSSLNVFKRYYQACLTYDFIKSIHVLEPELVVIENVLHYEKSKEFNALLEVLDELGYNVTYKVMNFADYGLPQIRRRLILVACKNKRLNLDLPKVENHVTLNQAIGRLPILSNGETDNNDPLHRVKKLTDITLKRIQNIKQGQDWREIKKFLPKGAKYFNGSYGRANLGKPSPTITAQAGCFSCGRFIHPTQDRLFSLRELAIIQGFPMSYKFLSESYNQIVKQIGNAVPPMFSKQLAEHIKKQLEG